MIRFGPSGIPLSCKGRTLRDGIEDVHTLGLTALEVQIVRTNVEVRHADEDDIGQIPTQVEDALVIEVQRGGEKNPKATMLDEPIEKGDIILSMINPIAKNFIQLKQLGEIAKNLDVVLSVHTPYYMDLVANDDLTKRSTESIRWAGILAKALGAQIVLTHVGMYGDHSKKEATKNITDNIAAIQKWYDESDVKIPLGLETSGRQEIFGAFEEIERICEQIKGPVPVINFPHVHARGNGSLKKKEDFQELFDRANKFTKGKFYTHFSGVEHENGNEIRYTPIKKGDLKFEPLAECILENDMELTVISGSPLLEHDAMYMKVILERVLSKREAKAERQKAKETELPEPKPKPKVKAPAKKPVPKAKAPAKKAQPKPVQKKQTGKKPAPKPKVPVKKPVQKPSPKKPAAKKAAAPAKKPVSKPKAQVKKPMQKPAPKKPAIKKAAAPAKAPASKAKPAPKKPVAKKAAAPAKKPVPKAPVKKPAVKKPQPSKKTPSKAQPKKPAPNKKQPQKAKTPAKKPAPKKKR